MLEDAAGFFAVSVIQDENANGALDTSFGTNGFVRRNFRNATTPYDVGLDTQGRIVACGTISQTAAPDVGCARFNP